MFLCFPGAPNFYFYYYQKTELRRVNTNEKMINNFQSSFNNKHISACYFLLALDADTRVIGSFRWAKPIKTPYRNSDIANGFRQAERSLWEHKTSKCKFFFISQEAWQLCAVLTIAFEFSSSQWIGGTPSHFTEYFKEEEYLKLLLTLVEKKQIKS